MEIKIKAFLRCVQSDSESSSKNGDVRKFRKHDCSLAVRLLTKRAKFVEVARELIARRKSPAWRCRWLPEMPLALDCYSPVHIWQITCSENASRSDKRLRHYIRAQNGRGRTMTNAAQKALLWNLILEIKQFISPFLCSLCGWTFAHIQIVACLLTTRGLNLNNVINTGDVLLWLFTPPVSKWVCNFACIFLVSGLKGKTGANKFW